MQIIKLNRQIKKRLIFLFIIFFCFAFSIFLISYTLKDQIAYFVSPTELKQMNLASDKYLRVGGLVKSNSLKFQNEKWNFVVEDVMGGSIKVEFAKSLPGLVEEEKGIIVEGYMGRNSIFLAEIVLAKHDENYMPQSAIDKMKNDGIWRGD